MLVISLIINRTAPESMSTDAVLLVPLVGFNRPKFFPKSSMAKYRQFVG